MIQIETMPALPSQTTFDRLVSALVLAATCQLAAACRDTDPQHLRLNPFPTGFRWGTATAPYQVEGGLHGTDFYEWESTPQNRRMEHADDGPDEFDFFDSDFELAKQLDNNAVRLGIDWSRLFPTAASFPDSPDSNAVAHYHAVLASAKAHGLSPMVTLYHWALPLWIQDLKHLDVAKGWLDDRIVDQFATFAGWAAAEFGGEVDLWITLNEPTSILAGGYLNGVFPPEHSYTDLDAIAHVLQATRNMIYAAAAAYDAIHRRDVLDADGDGTAAQVSCAFSLPEFEPAHPDRQEDVAATRRLHYISNEALLNALTRGNLDYDLDEQLNGAADKTADPALVGRLDYIGVNYYGPIRVMPLPIPILGPFTGLPQQTSINDQRPHTESTVSIDPAGLRRVLDEVKTYHLPLIITENGLADSSDAQRPRFLIDHLYVIEKALQDGLDIRGYYHWSLIDNFEWNAGYCPRFGLFHVDYNSPTKSRSAGEGARTYQRIILRREVDPTLFMTFPDYPAAPARCQGGF